MRSSRSKAALAFPMYRRTPTEIPVSVVVPVHTFSSNAREHWRTKARRVRNERLVVAWLLVTRHPVVLPVTVQITRCGPRELDGDNLQTACKGIRDEIARWLGADDNDKRIVWMYSQQPSKTHRVLVEVTRTP